MTRTPNARPGAARTLLTAAGALTLLVAGGCADSAGDDRAGQVSESPAPTPTGATPSDAVIDPELPPGETPAPTPVGGRPWDERVTAECEREMSEQDVGGRAAGGQDAEGLKEVAQSVNDGGVTSFWVDGQRWVVCDLLPGASVPPALLVSGRQGTEFDDRRLGLRSTVVTGSDGEPAAVRLVAGGRLPWPVQEIDYTFPDGHSEDAGFVRSDDGSGDTWWSVTYTATDGVLVDPDTEPADLDPLEISIVGAAAEAFRLPWVQAVRTQRSE